MAKPIYLNTTGTLSPVPVNDLGKIPGYIHPTVDWDITEEYSLSAISNSVDLQAAVDAGYITLTASDGSSIDSIRDQGEGSVGVSEDSVSIVERAAFLNFLGNVSITGVTGVANITIPVPDAEQIFNGLQGSTIGIGLSQADELETSTAGNTFVEKMSVDFGEGLTGINGATGVTYLLEWNWEHTCSSPSRVVETRVMINDIFEAGNDKFQPSNQNDFAMRHGFVQVELGFQTNHIDIDFRRIGTGSSTVAIRRVRIKVSRVNV